MELEGCIRSIEVEAMLVESQGSDEEPLPPAASQSRWGARLGVLAVMAASVGLAVIATRAWATRAPSAIADTIELHLTPVGSNVAWDYYAPAQCQNDSHNILGSGPEADDAACELTCKNMSECIFVAYCPPAKQGCVGPQKNNCVRYRSCKTLDSNYRGYTTKMKVSAPAALAALVYHAPARCRGDSYNILGSEPQVDENACMLTCTNMTECIFVAYGPPTCNGSLKTGHGCLGPQKNNCVRYRSCETLDSNYDSYTTKRKVRGSPPPAPAPGVAFTWDYYAPARCQGDSHNMLGSERQAGGEEACMLTCAANKDCMFTAYCPETHVNFIAVNGGTEESEMQGCLGAQKNNCVRYRACATLDSNFHGYTTHMKRMV